MPAALCKAAHRLLLRLLLLCICTSCDYEKPAVFRLIRACGQRHQLISVLRDYSRIVLGQRLDALYILIEIRLRSHACILIILEFRRILRIDLRIPGSDHLVRPLSALVYRIEPKGLVILVKVLVVVLLDITEHRAVLHVMSVDQEI